jgi:diacylglycerol kinase (ATP)
VKSGRVNIKERLRSFKFAFSGLCTLLKEEPNARIHLAGAFAAILLGILLNISKLEWAVVAIVSGIVFIAELFNTALERLSDLVEPEFNEKIKRVKDLAAGAVIVSAIIALIAGIIIFLPGIATLFRHYF